VPSSGPGRRNAPDPSSNHTTPRRLSQHSHQPSLSTPRGLADVTVLDSEEESEDDSVDIKQALEAQLRGSGNQSAVSSRSTSLDPLSQSLNSGETSNTPRRHSIIGGTSAVAATSSREAFAIYNTIEKSKSHQSPDNSIALDRSPFKKKQQQPSLFSTPKAPAPQTISNSKPLPRSTRSSSRQMSVTPAVESVRRSERVR
jgi:hypothetical protein